jgi:hypothetical protein
VVETKVLWPRARLLSGTRPIVCVLPVASEVPLASAPYKTVLVVCCLLVVVLDVQ